MPKAMVSIAVTQIAPGTIGHGVRLTEDRMPRSGYPGASRDARLRHIDLRRSPNLTSVPARSNAPKPHAHRNPNAGNPYQDAPSK